MKPRDATILNIAETPRAAATTRDPNAAWRRLAGRRTPPGEESGRTVSRLTKDRADTWTAIADEANLTIETVLPDHEVWVSSVPGGVEQILDNLLDNAMSASPPGATITATISEGSDRHELSVSDSGPGLDDANKRRATERFWRADPSQPGTGLGLAIIKSLVDASHGELTLADNSPTGLVVTVAFDAARPPNLDPAITAGQNRRRQQ